MSACFCFFNFLFENNFKCVESYKHRIAQRTSRYPLSVFTYCYTFYPISLFAYVLIFSSTGSLVCSLSVSLRPLPASPPSSHTHTHTHTIFQNHLRGSYIYPSIFQGLFPKNRHILLHSHSIIINFVILY